MEDAPPEPLDSAILFAPVGTLVPTALAALDRSGTLAIAGIHLSDIPPLNYQRHLFEEREPSQRDREHPADGEEFLRPWPPHRPSGDETSVTPFTDANRALSDLARRSRVNGAAVLFAD